MENHAFLIYHDKIVHTVNSMPLQADLDEGETEVQEVNLITDDEV